MNVADKTLDTTGLTCPLPVMKAKKALADVPVGGTLEVISDDAASVEDFKALAKSTGHALVDQTASNGVYRHVLKRAR